MNSESGNSNNFNNDNVPNETTRLVNRNEEELPIETQIPLNDAQMPISDSQQVPLKVSFLSVHEKKHKIESSFILVSNFNPLLPLVMKGWRIHNPFAWCNPSLPSIIRTNIELNSST